MYLIQDNVMSLILTIYRIASHLTLGVFWGTTTTQGTFATSWEQAYATACP
jgi:hypothetical protein